MVEPSGKVHILCIGNLWRGDDGLGVHLARRLRECKLADTVTVIDVGTLGIGAMSYLEDCDEALLIDAMAFQGEEGAVHEFSYAEVPQLFGHFSSHSWGVSELCQLIPIAFQNKTMPRIRILGVEIRHAERFTDELTQPIAAVVEQLALRLARDYGETNG